MQCPCDPERSFADCCGRFLEGGQQPETAEELKWMKKKVREDAVKPLEQAFLLAALERNDWNVTRAAEEVGMLRPNFQSLLKKQGISLKERGIKADS